MLLANLFAFAMAAQSTEQSAIADEMKDTLARSDQVVDRAIACMDSQTKVEIKAQILDLSPEKVVDSSLKFCDYIRTEYITAVSSNGSPITREAGEKLANELFQNLRKIYIKHVDEFMVKPKFADLRLEIVILEWRKCVVNKARSWSRLKDEATTIAGAALTSCRAAENNFVSAAGYQLRSKGIAASYTSEMIDKLRGTMKDVAIEAVISERAKAMPSRR